MYDKYKDKDFLLSCEKGDEKMRLTQRMPWLLPIRKKQRVFCFYLKMALDRNAYAKLRKNDELKFIVSEVQSTMINHNTGFDIQYQKNKVFNLSLASSSLNYIIINPHEVFSLWQLLQNADKCVSYKDGLIVVNGKTTTSYGGGLCQLSNLLYDLFLHSPLTIVERVGHRIKEFPELSNDSVLGIDATIAEGWIDLKVKNETDQAYQIEILFEDETIIARLRCNKECDVIYEVYNRNTKYYLENYKVVEETDVCRKTRNKNNNVLISDEKMYRNRCILGYKGAEDKLKGVQ